MMAIGRNSKKIMVAENNGMPTYDTPDKLSCILSEWQNMPGAGILVTDEKYRCTWVNDVFIQLLAIAPVNQSFSDLIRFFKSKVTNGMLLEKKMKSVCREKKRLSGWKIPFLNGQILEIAYIPVFSKKHFKGSIWQIINVTHQYSFQNEKNFVIYLITLMPSNIKRMWTVMPPKFILEDTSCQVIILLLNAGLLNGPASTWML